ncbi:hypothetical protein HGRIS_002839 [Hohenbuehelia grisea]|uniref:Uncharacterized protein n=1 Tax=Hohenbuehelia grisea TaxID=104357 RepID=A0ABR3JN18_9AGAR
MEGRTKIVQMVIGGTTQYPTMVQGMPGDVEKKLEKRAVDFVWDDKTSNPVSKNMLYAPIKQGGRNLLDIKARNEAIRITWLKEYLKLSPEHATWAYFVDELFALNVPKSDKNVPWETRMNPMLQTWKTHRGNQSETPKYIRELLKTATKHNVRLEGLYFSKEVLQQMPIWYHKEADARIRLLNHSKAAKCLRENHRIKTAGDTEALAEKGNTPYHCNRNNCKCQNCKDVRTGSHCRTPNTCYKKAKELLDTLPRKWDPRKATSEKEIEALKAKLTTNIEGGAIFDPINAVKGNLAGAFRIFTKGKTGKGLPPKAKHLCTDEDPQLIVATDGSCTVIGLTKSYPMFSRFSPLLAACYEHPSGFIPSTFTTGPHRPPQSQCSELSPRPRYPDRTPEPTIRDGLRRISAEPATSPDIRPPIHPPLRTMDRLPPLDVVLDP